MMNVDITKIKDRVRKLLTLAGNEGAFEGEIDNALRAARKLMIEHNISENDINLSENPNDVAARDKYAKSNAYSRGDDLTVWESTLMQAITKLVGTIGVYQSTQRVAKSLLNNPAVTGKSKFSQVITFFGPIKDAQDATELFHEWVHIIATMGKKKYGKCLKGDGKNYCEGFAMSLFETVVRIEREEAAAKAGASTGRELVIVKATDLMDAKRQYAKVWLQNEAGIHLTRGKAKLSKLNDPNAYRAGSGDGRSANFTRNVTRKLT